MNKLLFLSLFTFCFGNAQNQRFSYVSKAILEKEITATGSMNVKSDMRKGLFRHVIIKESPDFKTFLMTLRNGQGNIGGKMTDINEFIRDREKQQEENNLKGNNILEVDLLK